MVVLLDSFLSPSTLQIVIMGLILTTIWLFQWLATLLELGKSDLDQLGLETNVAEAVRECQRLRPTKTLEN
eukprot:SAG31_NODE_6909_length_1854_cov_1.378917_2_plen_71_part_00